MPIKTYTIWALDKPTESEVTTIHAYAAQMASQGKTDNLPIIQPTPDNLNKECTRTWVSVGDAENWNDFVLSFTPISSTVITE